MIDVIDSFDLQNSVKPLDARNKFTSKKAMQRCNVCDEGHICYCEETHKSYRFRTKDDEGNSRTYDNSEGGLGYWEEFQPGGGGEGTITGATIGGNPVTESGGVLQLPAYPTVPITGIKDANNNTLAPDGSGIVTLPAIPNAPTADTMQYGDSNSYSNGSIGKALKDIRKPGANLNTNFKYAVSRSGDPSLIECLNVMWDELHPVETTDPTPVSPTIVDLDGYDETDDSFIYNDDTIYIYGASNTSKVVYNDNGTDYAVFKVNDVDKYIRYEISESGSTITYTCEDTYTLSNLPVAARNLFEISKYAAVKIITGTKTDWFFKARYTVFVDSNNRPMQNDFYEAIESNTTVNYALFKSNSNGDLYLYKANNTYYQFQSKITSSDANYATYDAHFGASSANKISFNDNVSHLSIPGATIDNVQDAIDAIVAQNNSTSRLVITLLYGNATPVANKQVQIETNYQGNSFDISSQYTPGFTGFKTDSNGQITLSLPLGVVYNLHFYDISDDYLTPEDISGISDSILKNVNVVYQNAINVEYVYFFVQMPNVSPSSNINVNNKIINIYHVTGVNTSELWYKCVLRANGTVKQILNADNTQATYGGEDLISVNDPVLLPIARGEIYIPSLQLWDTSLPENEQKYIKSPVEDTQYTASKSKRTILFSYLDKQVGLYILVSDSTTNKGYREYQVLNVDNTNNKCTFKDGDVEYEAYIEDSTLYKKAIIEGAIRAAWEESILGIGVRTSITENIDNNDNITNVEYPKCSFFIPLNGKVFSAPILNNPSQVTLDNTEKGGLALTRALYQLSGDVYSPAANAILGETTYDINLTTVNGAKIIKGFIGSIDQSKAIVANKTDIYNLNRILAGRNIASTSSGVGIFTSSPVSATGATFYRVGREFATAAAVTAYIDGSQANHYIFVIYPF